MSEPGLYQLEGVTKSYGAEQVLHIDRLEVAGGETLCLVGPTGAGKSTLLRLLAALEPPTSGQLRFREYDLGRQVMPVAVRRQITMVFQRPLALAGSVRANVAYGLKLRGVSRRRARVEEMLKRLGLTGLASRPAHTLSGGQLQLVALARALVMQPDVLLLDEPTANLDPGHVALVEEVLREVQQQDRTTLVWATHNIFQAKRRAERVALLLNGRVVEVAPRADFFHRPQDPRTAAFVRGEMVY
jgi:tungstate transport system ATP-binding protein